MKKMRIFYFFIGFYLIHLCKCETSFKVKEKTISYMIYFTSYFRGICNGFMVARNVALTAAVCVTNPFLPTSDTRPLNIVVGASYRHQRRGIKVQVTKILIPEFPDVGNVKDYYMQKAPAVLLLKRKVPDILVDVPVRAMDLDYKGDVSLSLQEQCFMAGWHFHGRGDKIYPVNKFLLQRNLRVQFVHIVKRAAWCESLMIKFQKALDNMGFEGQFDPGAYVCVADGMYGAPLVCQGKAVGMMMAPDAQWTNCTGFSNIIHLFSSQYLINFMHCVSSLFTPDTQPDWTAMQTQIYDEPDPAYYDYVADLYDKLIFIEGDDD